ncbi:MAG: NAD(P)H-dependent glycerol-3-phosphate dehydrogenase [Pseudomonadota bacterium]
MTRIAILGAGAFGSALAIALGRAEASRTVALWGRGLAPGARLSDRLPDHPLPSGVTVARSIQAATHGASTILIALPMKALGALGSELADVAAPVIACCKGIDPDTLTGPSAVLAAMTPAPVGVLTGPSFAHDIARGLPTALSLALDHPSAADTQQVLSTSTLRVYRTDDVTGAELGGALKNVLAIAAGACAGAGLGQSAQAALLTRGFAEARAFALARGARADTFAGLSGLGDLMLTAWSDGSRNYRYGLAIGQGHPPDPGMTVEGVATAAAIARLARRDALDLPVLTMTHRLITGEIGITNAVTALMARPLKEE